MAGLSRWQGRWRVHRHLSNGMGFTGLLTLSPLPDGAGLLFDEELTSPAFGTQVRARKAYRLYLDPTGGPLVICHADAHNDGEAFQSLTLRWVDGAFRARASNLCGKDHYASQYVLGRNALFVRHEVRGPRKSYDMSSRYQRCGRD